jgi:hypothetical protein
MKKQIPKRNSPTNVCCKPIPNLIEILGISEFLDFVHRLIFVQWLRLAVSNEVHRAGSLHSFTWGWKHIQFPKREPGYLSGYSEGLRVGRPGFHSRQEQEIFLFSTVSRLALGPTQPPIQWVLGAFSPGAKRPGREANHSPLSSAEVKNGGAIPPLQNTPPWRGA